MDVNVIGNSTEVKTQVHVGVSAQMRQELSDLQKSIEENGEVIKKITTGLKQFELVAAQKELMYRKIRAELSFFVPK